MIITPLGIACIAAIGGVCGGFIVLWLVNRRPDEWAGQTRDKGWREPFEAVDRARDSGVKDAVFGQSPIDLAKQQGINARKS